MTDYETDVLSHLGRALELLDLEPCGVVACHVQHAIDILIAERAELLVQKMMRADRSSIRVAGLPGQSHQ